MAYKSWESISHGNCCVAVGVAGVVDIGGTRVSLVAPIKKFLTKAANTTPSTPEKTARRKPKRHIHTIIRFIDQPAVHIMSDHEENTPNTEELLDEMVGHLMPSLTSHRAIVLKTRVNNSQDYGNAKKLLK